MAGDEAKFSRARHHLKNHHIEKYWRNAAARHRGRASDEHLSISVIRLECLTRMIVTRGDEAIGAVATSACAYGRRMVEGIVALLANNAS